MPYARGVSDDTAGDAPGTPEPRWLSADERQTWLAMSRALLILPAALDAQLQRDASLTYFEYIVLAMLSERPERSLPMSQLSSVVAGSLSRLSNVIKRLEARGYVRRDGHPADRRVKVVHLEDAGWAALVEAAPAHVEHVRDLVIDALRPRELTQLRHALLKVLDQVDPEGRSVITDPT